MNDDGRPLDEQPMPPPPPAPKPPAGAAPPPPPPPPPAPRAAEPEQAPELDEAPSPEEAPELDEGSQAAPPPVSPVSPAHRPPAAAPPVEPAPAEPAPAHVRTKRRGSPVRTVIGLLVLALIAYGIYVFFHHRNNKPEPTRTQIGTPATVLGATRSAADGKQLDALNATMVKRGRDADIVAANYLRGGQVDFALTGINGQAGGWLDYGKPSIASVLRYFPLGVTPRDLEPAAAGSGGGRMACGTAVRDGQTLDVCVWTAHERAGLVAFPQGGATGQLAEQTRKIRAAVEKHVTDE